MIPLPDTLKQAWDERDGPVVFATVDGHGVPNAIYASCVRVYDDEHIIVADNFFSKTRANIDAGSKGAILFITRGGTSYQVKGSIEYDSAGAYYQDMKGWNGERPGHAAAVLCVEEVYRGAQTLA